MIKLPNMIITLLTIMIFTIAVELFFRTLPNTNGIVRLLTVGVLFFLFFYLKRKIDVKDTKNIAMGLYIANIAIAFWILDKNIYSWTVCLILVMEPTLFCHEPLFKFKKEKEEKKKKRK